MPELISAADIKPVTTEEQTLVNYVKLYEGKTIAVKSDTELGHSQIQRIRHYSEQKFSIGELKKAIGLSKYRVKDGIDRLG